MSRSVIPDVVCRTGLVDFASRGNEPVDAAASWSDREACSGVSVVCWSSVPGTAGLSGVSGSAKDMSCVSSPPLWPSAGDQGRWNGGAPATRECKSKILGGLHLFRARIGGWQFGSRLGSPRPRRDFGGGSRRDGSSSLAVQLGGHDGWDCAGV
jgi:hypothetical protein